MRRQLWLILIGLSAGVGLVSLLSFDAGYVLVQFGQYRIESTVVASAIALLLLGMVLFVILRLISTVFGVGPGIGRWLEKRREDKGLALLQSTVLDMFNERSVSQHLPKLRKTNFLTESDRAAAELWVLMRELNAAERQKQLKRIWREADVSLKQDVQVIAIYTDKLLQFGLVDEAEAALQDLAKSTWNASASAALSKINLKDAAGMVNSLAALSSKGQAADVDLALAIAKAQLLPRNEAQALLTEHYQKAPSPQLLTALGTVCLKGD